MLLIIIIAAFSSGGGDYPPIGPCDDLYGQAYDDCVFGSIDEIIPGGNGGDVVVPNDPPPPPPNPFQNLSGPWTDQWGTQANVSVDRNGRLSGTGRGPDGTSFNLSGQLSRNSTMGLLSIPAYGLTLDIELRWDGGCHIDYVTYNLNGSVNVAGRYHANHAAGAPCP